MSWLSRYFCLPTCLGLALAFYAYGTLWMPRDEAKVEAVSSESPPPLLPEASRQAPIGPLKPKASARPNADVTGSIGPGSKPRLNGDQVNGDRVNSDRMNGDRLPPGIRFASLATQAVPTKPFYPNRWTPAVLYHPIGPTSPQMSTGRQMGPPTARRLRKVRAVRPYRMRQPRFSVMIGVGPRW